ncbi:MAG: hypothetical protein MUE85_01345 [Microscillaceae bacterium]|jgi:hypothetical protein|nr:hypothetical protein [Microscillaceae bacterium]
MQYIDCQLFTCCTIVREKKVFVILSIIKQNEYFAKIPSEAPKNLDFRSQLVD